MNQIDELTEKLFEITKDKNRSDENKKECIRLMTKDYSTRLLNLMIDIQTTSLNQSDKDMRTELMCKKSGITFHNNKFI